MSVPCKYDGYDNKRPEFIAAQAASSPLVRQALHNNSYLIKKKGIKLTTQIASLGLKYDYYKSLMSGRRKSCKLTWLCFFSNYWGLSLVEMMSVDYRSRDELLAM